MQSIVVFQMAVYKAAPTGSAEFQDLSIFKWDYDVKLAAHTNIFFLFPMRHEGYLDTLRSLMC